MFKTHGQHQPAMTLPASRNSSWVKQALAFQEGCDRGLIFGWANPHARTRDAGACLDSVMNTALNLCKVAFGQPR